MYLKTCYERVVLFTVYNILFLMQTLCSWLKVGIKEKQK